MKRVFAALLITALMFTLSVPAQVNNHYLHKKAFELTKTYSSRDTVIYSTQTFSWESLDSLYFVIEGGQNLVIDARLEPGGPSKIYNYTTWDGDQVIAIQKALTDSLTNVQWAGPTDSLLNVHTAGRMWIKITQPLDTINGKAVSAYPITRTTKIWYLIKDR